MSCPNPSHPKSFRCTFLGTLGVSPVSFPWGHRIPCRTEEALQAQRGLGRGWGSEPTAPGSEAQFASLSPVYPAPGKSPTPLNCPLQDMRGAAYQHAHPGIPAPGLLSPWGWTGLSWNLVGVGGDRGKAGEPQVDSGPALGHLSSCPPCHPALVSHEAFPLVGKLIYLCVS